MLSVWLLDAVSASPDVAGVRHSAVIPPTSDWRPLELAYESWKELPWHIVLIELHLLLTALIVLGGSSRPSAIIEPGI